MHEAGDNCLDACRVRQRTEKSHFACADAQTKYHIVFPGSSAHARFPISGNRLIFL